MSRCHRTTLTLIGALLLPGSALAAKPAPPPPSAYTVTLASYALNESACETNVCWDVTSPTSQAISHFIVGISGCSPIRATVTSLTLGGVHAYTAAQLASMFIASDPRCGAGGIKFDDGFGDGEVRRVCMTFAGMLPQSATGNVQFTIKGGPTCMPTLGVPGPVCGATAGCEVGGCQGSYACGASGAECVKADPTCGSGCQDSDRDACGVCFGNGIPPGQCDCEGHVKDDCGVCGGQGVPSGACDCDGHKLDACGKCGGGGIPEGQCDCAGHVNDACGECGGPGIPEGYCTCDGTVFDDCGVCGGQGVPSGACDCAGHVEDACGKCGGGGIPEGQCDCAGHVNDACGECGGPGMPEGACDCAGNVKDDCGVCGGQGVPSGECDCAGHVEDACGKCGGGGIPEGQCDCAGHVNDACGECGGPGIPEGYCTCDGTVFDDCGVCGGQGVPSGACDCAGHVEDACGKCGGGGIPEGQCDCAGHVNDACGECGGEGMPEGYCTCDGTVFDDCGVCGGQGVPSGECDCAGHKVDACGKCGGGGIPEGQCDCAGHVNDECGECGGPGVPSGACDCDGQVPDACGLCGGSATDSEDCGSCPEGTQLGFGAAGIFNVMTCGDLVLGADSEGPAGIGGVASLKSFAVNSNATCAPGNGVALMVVAGSAMDGEIRGDLIAGGGFNQQATVCGSVTRDDGLSVWFDGRCAELANLQERLMGLDSNGIAANQGGTLMLQGGNALNIFSVDGGLLGASNNGIVIDVPPGSTVLVNVLGTDVWVNHSVTLIGTTAGRVLFNFDVATLHIADSEILGSILAPHADMYFVNGHVEGQTFVDNLYAPQSAEFHDVAFAGLTCPASGNGGGGVDDGGGTGAAFVCSGACLQATVLAAGAPSGELGLASRWFKVVGPLYGWQVSELQQRTVSINGLAVSPGQVPVAAADGAWYFQFSEGAPTWTAWSWW